MLTLLNLKYFCDVAETGSFTKAGKINHVAQTSITQQIKEIEKQLGTTLFDRKYKPVKLTNTGKIIYKEAKKVLKQYQIFDQKISQYISAKNHQVRIGYNSVVELSVLENLIDSIHENNITVVKLNISDEIRSLTEGKTDLIVTYDTALTDDKKVEIIPIAKGDFVACVNRHHPLADKENANIDEVYQFPLIMLSHRMIGQSYDIMTKRTEKIGLKLHIAEEVDDIDSELFLIEHNDYVGFLPKDYPIANKTNIKKISFIDSPYKYQIVVVKLKNNFEPNTVDLFNQIKLFS